MYLRYSLIPHWLSCAKHSVSVCDDPHDWWNNQKPQNAHSFVKRHAKSLVKRSNSPWFCSCRKFSMLYKITHTTQPLYRRYNIHTSTCIHKSSPAVCKIKIWVRKKLMTTCCQTFQMQLDFHTEDIRLDFDGFRLRSNLSEAWTGSCRCFW